MHAHITCCEAELKYRRLRGRFQNWKNGMKQKLMWDETKRKAQRELKRN
jgi:hypothetical protein